MRCLIVTCVFPPEPVVSGRTSAQIAETLARAGHDVTVIAPFPTRPAGRLYPGLKRRALQSENHPAGYRVVRCFSAPGRPGSRLLENTTFGFGAALAALFLRRPDVIYANTWPVVATALLSAIARLRGIPVVLSVQDLYPESLVAEGRFSHDAQITRALRAIDAGVARRAAGVIAISSAFRDTYRHDRGVPAERVHEVPNWIESDDRNVTD